MNHLVLSGFVLMIVTLLHDAFVDVGRAWHWALGYAVAGAFAAWIGFLGFVPMLLALWLYAWGYFALLRRIASIQKRYVQELAWKTTLLVGPIGTVLVAHGVNYLAKAV